MHDARHTHTPHYITTRFLTPDEFSSLTSALGVEMSESELSEAMMKIDDDGNGQIEVGEYLEWWGDTEVFVRWREQAEEQKSLTDQTNETDQQRPSTAPSEGSGRDIFRATLETLPGGAATARGAPSYTSAAAKWSLKSREHMEKERLPDISQAIGRSIDAYDKTGRRRRRLSRGSVSTHGSDAESIVGRMLNVEVPTAQLRAGLRSAGCHSP